MKIPKTGNIQKNNSETKNTTNISLYNLDILCKYIITDPAFIKISNVSILNTAINGLDKSVYDKDVEKTKRINFIRAVIEARLQYNLVDRYMIISHVVSTLGYTPDFIDMENTNLNKSEIEWCNMVISDLIKYSFLDHDVKELLDLGQAIQMSDFDHRGQNADKLKNLIDKIRNKYRKAEMNDSIVDMEFNLDPREFKQDVTNIYGVVSSPSRRLLTGMQGLNIMLGGGLESGRVYILLGTTGIGKSMLLLNLAYQIKKYNTKYQRKDPTKIPTVVYLTMENSVVESVTRLYDMTTDSQFGMSSYSLDEVLRKMQEEGQLVLTENNPINLYIKFKPNRSVDTSYLYTLYDDLQDKGYEPICFIQDHLLRIKSINGSNEPRFELGDIVNEFKSFATEKDIPFITNFHLNREAMKVMESYTPGRNQVDVTQKMGKSTVAESVMILNNTDIGIIINKDQDEMENVHMCFNLVKMRDKTNLFYFAQPYAYGGEIKLIEDVNGPPMYKEKLHTRGDAPDIANVRTSSANAMNTINTIVQMNGPVDASFLDGPNYNTIDEFDQIEEPIIRKKVAIDPFIWNLPREDPNLSVKTKMDGLEILKNQLQK